MNESQNNMDISFELNFNNTTRERDSLAIYTSVESSKGCSIVASLDLSNSSTVLSDIEFNEDEDNKLDLSNEICLVDSIKISK
jgi:hypothetical protein